jgi:hypothetical protein
VPGAPNKFQDRQQSRPISIKMRQEVAMTAIVQVLSRTFHSAQEIDVLKQIALFCGAGLLISLLLLSYGVDLSPGFF